MNSTKDSITIYDWMRGLGLRPLDLNVFALVYGYREDGVVYRGTSAMIARRLRCSDSGVRHALARLTDLGLIAESDGGLTVPDDTAKLGGKNEKSCHTAQETADQTVSDAAEREPEPEEGVVMDRDAALNAFKSTVEMLVTRLSRLTDDPQSLQQHFPEGNARMFHHAVKALRELTAELRSLCDLPTPKEQREYALKQERLAIQREHLELQKRKQSMAEEGKRDCELIVRFEGMDDLFDPEPPKGAA